MKKFIAFAAIPAAVPMLTTAGYVGSNDPSAGKPGQAVEWVLIGGGKFVMAGNSSLRAVDRFLNGPADRSGIIGFRLARSSR